MTTALAIAQKFERFVTIHGDDPFISKTLFKMVTTRLDALRKELKIVQAQTARFERLYGKSSDMFYQEYLAGTAGDNMDFVEWASLVKMRERLISEQAILKS
jgi:uncharacterized protein with HEPN domain